MMKMMIRLGKVLAVCLPSAIGVAYGLEWVLGIPISAAWLAGSTLVPVIVGMPVIFFIEGQSIKLRNAVFRLDQMREETAERAKRDSMTGLYTHQHFMEKIHESGRRDDGSLIILDIDHFKNINDNYGHAQGDEALIRVVAAVRKAVRAGDVVGRIGGEEFAVFLLDANKEEAKMVASRIRQTVESIEFIPKNGVKAPLTVSVGVAMKDEMDNVVGALQLADMRMYKAKQSGRNQVVDSGLEAEVFDLTRGTQG
ncbi:MAG: GGDEF domain-containing protein [Rhodobacteraceae bacterium]|nr:GGDEF domain-containing protein [Paracoccaceae bacterium]